MQLTCDQEDFVLFNNRCKWSLIDAAHSVPTKKKSGMLESSMI